MQLRDVLLFFTSNGFVWGESGAKSIYDQMNDRDKEVRQQINSNRIIYIYNQGHQPRFVLKK